MSWLACHRNESALVLISKHPAAFLLLSLIAIRARFHSETCPVTGLESGECFIGDWEECGQKSYKQYRVSKSVLQKSGYAAFKGASRGTIAKLLQVPENVMIYSISNDRSGQGQGQAGGKLGASWGPLTNKETRKQGNNVTGTIEEIEKFCIDSGLPKSDGTFLFHKWQGNDWMNGKQKIKDWKATIRSWKSAGYLPSQKTNTKTKEFNSNDVGI